MPKKSKQNWGISLFCKATHPWSNLVKKQWTCNFHRNFTCKYMSTLTHWTDFMCEARTFANVTRLHSSEKIVKTQLKILAFSRKNWLKSLDFGYNLQIDENFNNILSSIYCCYWFLWKEEKAKKKIWHIRKENFEIFSLKLDTDTP